MIVACRRLLLTYILFLYVFWSKKIRRVVVVPASFEANITFSTEKIPRIFYVLISNACQSAFFALYLVYYCINTHTKYVMKGKKIEIEAWQCQSFARFCYRFKFQQCIHEFVLHVCMSMKRLFGTVDVYMNAFNELASYPIFCFVFVFIVIFFITFWYNGIFSFEKYQNMRSAQANIFI